MLRVLTYHRVAPIDADATLGARLISATPQDFEWQLAHLAKHYHVISIEEVLAAVASSAPLPRRSVLITFDDGYRDFYEIAWPILKRFGLPVTLFVPTYYPAHPESRFWWDRLYFAFIHTAAEELTHPLIGTRCLNGTQQRRRSLRQLLNLIETMNHYRGEKMVDEICDTLGAHAPSARNLMTWDELRQVAAEGVSLGAHTRNHAILNQLTVKECVDEILGSQQDLVREIGHALPVFCYPSGRHNDAVVQVLREAGFVLAFTTIAGQNDLNSTDLLRLRRTNITTRTTFPIFRLRLTRSFSVLARWRQKVASRDAVRASAPLPSAS